MFDVQYVYFLRFWGINDPIYKVWLTGTDINFAEVEVYGELV